MQNLPKRIPPIVGSFLSYGGLVLMVILVITAILMLVRTITCNSNSNSNPANAYEHFESPTLQTVRSRISFIERLRGEISMAVEELATASDETCAISKELEEIYVSNLSTPDTQSDLPPDMQTRLGDARKKRATANYQQKKARFGATLECFTAGTGAENVEAETTMLETQVRELEELMDSAEVRMADIMSTKINTMLKFNYRIIDEAMMQFGAAKNKEGFTTAGMEVLAKADVLIGKANTFLDTVRALKKEIKTQRGAANELNKKFSSFQSGNYNASDAAAIL